MTITPYITVNGVTIQQQTVMEETQYHPAESLFSAQYYATRALVIRELLLQRAAQLQLWDKKSDENKVIEDLIDAEVEFQTADEDTCRKYYQNNKKRFMTSPLFEVAHILYLAPPDNKSAQKVALTKAEIALEKITKKPDLFGLIAQRESACSSAKDSGRLGQISQGQTAIEFEQELFTMRAGQISRTPVLTPFGYHIIKVYERVDGHQLAYEQVVDWIKDHLETQNEGKALQHYIKILAGQANIKGFAFESNLSPLVQ